MADWLEQREPGDLLDEVRRFARRRPGAFVLGALVAGVVAGRMTRGIVAARSDESDGDQSPQWSSATAQPYPAAETPVISGGLLPPAVPGQPEFTSPYDQAAASPQTPPAYVTDPSPASGAPMYGAPGYAGGTGYDPQEQR
jgi:hypothetical protein